MLLYIIDTGRYPFYDGLTPYNEDKFAYEDRVRALFEQGIFPDLAGVMFKDVIAGCCCER